MRVQAGKGFTVLVHPLMLCFKSPYHLCFKGNWQDPDSKQTLYLEVYAKPVLNSSFPCCVGKQPKGKFAIENYRAQLASHLRKDARRDCCFELTCPGKRTYEVGLAEKESVLPKWSWRNSWKCSINPFFPSELENLRENVASIYLNLIYLSLLFQFCFPTEK